MTIYSFYSSTGEIVLQTDILASEVAGLTPVGGGSYLGKTDSKTQYFLAGVLTARPLLAALPLYEIAADGVASATFALPSGTVVTCINYEYPEVTTAGENFIYTSTVDRVDTFYLDPPHPYLPMQVRIEAGVPSDQDEELEDN